MKHLWLIVQREYLTKIRNRSFIVMTFVSPLAIIALSVLIGYLTNLNNDTKRTITILDNSGLFAKTFENTPSYQYNYITGKEIEVVRKEALSSGVYGLLYIPKTTDSLWRNIEFFSEDSPNPSLINGLTQSLEQTIFYQELQKGNISIEYIEKVKPEVDIQLQTYSGERTSKISSLIKYVFGAAAGYLLMMFIIIYGNMIMRSVIEEKTNRIIEIIISSVKPLRLMLGKIFGTTLVGITQVLMWLIIGGIMMTILTSIFGVSPSASVQMPNLETETTRMVSEILLEFFKFPIMKLVAAFFLYFIGGFLLYSSLYAAIGAAVDNETDTQQFIFPVLMPLMLAIYVGFFTSMEDPHGAVSVIFSYIPFTSPITMPMRVPYGVSWGEIFISVAILYGTFFLTIWFASKIYRIGILMYGKKASYKDLYKWLKSNN